MTELCSLTWCVRSRCGRTVSAPARHQVRPVWRDVGWGRQGSLCCMPRDVGLHGPLRPAPPERPVRLAPGARPRPDPQRHLATEATYSPGELKRPNVNGRCRSRPRTRGTSSRARVSDMGRGMNGRGATGDRPVGFQNSAAAADLRFQAAGSYSLITPPRTGRRRILRWTGSGTGDSGRGGRSCSARCGRRVL
jgi:hypothetical protein